MFTPRPDSLGFFGACTSATCFLNALLRESAESVPNGNAQAEHRFMPFDSIRCGGNLLIAIR